MNAFKYCSGKSGQGEILPIATKKGIHRIDLSDVLYFEKDLRKIKAYGAKEEWTFYGKLLDLENVLDESFCRCHNSIIVNLAKVISLKRFQISMHDGKEVAVSQKRYTIAKLQYRIFLNKSKMDKTK